MGNDVTDDWWDKMMRDAFEEGRKAASTDRWDNPYSNDESDPMDQILHELWRKGLFAGRKENADQIPKTD